MAAAGLQSCATPTIVVTDSPPWPFQELRIHTAAVGPLSGYLSRPPADPQRLVVVVQSPPCDESNSGHGVSTSGVLWEQFKHDAAFLQFERPGGALGESSARLECGENLRPELTVDSWHLALSEAVAAVRAHEKLAGIPAIYIGASEGAVPAARLAVADRRAAALVLMSASGFSQRLEWLVATLHASHIQDAPLRAANDRINSIVAGHARQAGFDSARSVPYWRSVLDVSLREVLDRRPHLPVTIVHGTRDERAPIESALALFSELAPDPRALTMVAVQNSGPDLGLGSQRPECYESVVREIAARIERSSRTEDGSAAPDLVEVRCDQ